MFDVLLLILLGIFFLLYGILAVTSLQVTWSQPLMGFSALAVGIICIVRAVRGGCGPTKPC